MMINDATIQTIAQISGREILANSCGSIRVGFYARLTDEQLRQLAEKGIHLCEDGGSEKDGGGYSFTRWLYSLRSTHSTRAGNS